MDKEKDSIIKTLQKSKISKKIITLFQDIDKSVFFDPLFKNKLYGMEPIPIGLGQKSDDPLTLARMIQILQPQKSWNLLEVGTGSGYSTSILASMVKNIVTVEYHESLALKAKKNLIESGFNNIRFFAGDASELSEALGQFDALIIFAACIHSPHALLNALAPEGIAVFPMGPAHQQQITRYENTAANPGGAKNYKFHDFCSFDSIRGRYGYVDQIEGYIVDDSGD